MRKNHRFILLTLAVLLALVFSSIQTVLVRADDTLPPPPATEEPVQPPVEEPVVIEESVATETPVLDPIEEAATLPEVLEQLPEETTVVVLDASGEALPLATQEAANVLVSGDPMWCPAGVLPGGTGCTTNFASPQALIDDIDSSNPDSTNSIYERHGVIYLTEDPGGAFLLTPGPGSELQVADYNALKGYNLILQGGWNGLNEGSGFALSGQTNFGGNRVQIGQFSNPWVGNITLNNITIDGTSDAVLAGLIVVTTGNINLNNVESQNNAARGARLINDSGDGNVTVQNSNFTGNGGMGVLIASKGVVTLVDVTAHDNNNHGVSINTLGDVNVTNGAFGYYDTVNDISKGNARFGLEIYSGENITLNNVIASNNSYSGAYLNNINGTGNVIVTASQFNENGWGQGEGVVYGLSAHTSANISLSNVIANGNRGGAALDNLNRTGSITVTDSQFNDNEYGIASVSSGNITFYNVTANGNDYGGAYLDNAWEGSTGSITIIASQFNQNGWGEGHERGVGLSAFSNNNISLLDVTAHNNYDSGAYLDNWWEGATGSIFVTSSEFMNNGLETVWDGITAYSPKNITVQCSRFENNGDYGIYSELNGGTLTLNGNTFIDSISGDTYLDGGTLVDNPDYVCQVVSEPPTPTTAAPTLTSDDGETSVNSNGLPLNIIHVTGGEKHNLSCNGFSGTELILPNGDRVIIPCPNGEEASLDSVANGELPGALDGNYTFLSALDASVDPSLIGSMTVSFVIPVGKQDEDLTILHWDGTKWEELGGYKSSDTFFKVQTGSTGFFVLASK